MRLKKQSTLIVALIILFAVLLGVYFALIRPLMKEQGSASSGLKLLDGEVLISDKLTTFYIFEPIPREKILGVQVENEYGGFTLSRTNAESIIKASDPDKVTLGGFTLNGYGGLPFDDNKLASLIVTTGTPIAMMRVAEDVEKNPDKLAEYGLDEPQAKWTLTDIYGNAYTFYVGDKLITEGGYYVKYADRDAVYIISTTVEDTVLAHGYDLISPVLISGLSDNNYYLLDSFTLFNGEEPQVAVKRIPTQNDTLSLALAYPRSESGALYELNENLYFDVAYSFINLSGESVVAMFPTEETLGEFGLDDPAFSIMLTYGASELDIFFSHLTDDGYYYATSSVYSFSTIVKIPRSSVAWMDYEDFKWIEDMPFYVDIKTVSKLSVKSADGSVDLRFALNHGQTEDGYATLEVVENNTVKIFRNEDVANFRKYYLTLMNITNQEYASLSDEDKNALTSDDSKLIMTMTYENTSGRVFEYKFYKYYEASTGQLSGGKVFVTVNGIGEFYTTNDLVEKALSDADRVMKGLDIDSYGHN